MEKTDWLLNQTDDDQPFEYQTPTEMVKAGKFVTIAAPMVRYSKYVIHSIGRNAGSEKNTKIRLF